MIRKKTESSFVLVLPKKGQRGEVRCSAFLDVYNFERDVPAEAMMQKIMTAGISDFVDDFEGHCSNAVSLLER